MTPVLFYLRMKFIVFITRDLNPEDELAKKLIKIGTAPLGISMLKIEGVFFRKSPQTEWIFFYSKNGVRFFWEGLSEELRFNVSKNSKLAAIGSATGQLTKELFGKCDFIGDGNPENTARQFLACAQNKSVLFPRGENSRQSIQKLLSGRIDDYDLIVYFNRPKESEDLPKSLRAQIIIFTSPINTDTFFEYFDVTDKQKIISIGNTTAEALRNWDIHDFIIAESPTADGLVKAVQKAIQAMS